MGLRRFRKAKYHAETLRKAALLLKESGWCQRAFARDSAGRRIDHDSPSACSFCAEGAIWRAIHDNEYAPTAHPWNAKRLFELHLGQTIHSFNDVRGRGVSRMIRELLKCADDISNSSGEFVKYL